jgi:hypothetical protein
MSRKGSKVTDPGSDGNSRYKQLRRNPIRDAYARGAIKPGNSRLYHGLGPCDVCGREGHGFSFRLNLDSRAPNYEFCSMKCRDIAAKICDREGVMSKEKLTQMEKTAIVDARRQFADEITKQGLMHIFIKAPPDVIDAIIKACVIGFQASMHKQSAIDGNIPF